MKRALPLFLTLLCLALCSIPTFAQTPDAIATDTDDAATAGRVVRVSFVDGDVSFQRAGTTEWAAVIENLPLFPGDQIYAGQNARVELQLGRGSYIRLSENTALTVTDLRDNAAQFEVPAGIAFIRIERLATAFQRFEIDTPNAALLFQQDGLYRVNVTGDNNSEVIVRRGAADISTEDGSFKVREGRRLLIDTSANGRLEVASDTSQDDWDQWNAGRDATIDGQYIQSSPDYVTQYETSYDDYYGVSDLSSYGSWYDDPDYGYCWHPSVGSNWAPYRQGQWIWTPRAGWTWVSNEPWGWAPYHYGRWTFNPTYGWVWAPGYGRPVYNSDAWRAYFRWRPALVGFVDVPSPQGHYVGWYPLGPRDAWRRPDTQQRGGDHSHLQYPTNGANWRRPGNGLTVMPIDGFDRSNPAHTRPVVPDKDLGAWVGHGARPGLPDIKPGIIATAPVPREGQRPHIAIPSNDILRRPVVTRNRPTDSQVTVNPARERRLVAPRTPVLSNTDGKTGPPASGKPNRKADDSLKPTIIQGLPAENGSRADDKAKRGDDTTSQPSTNNSSNNSSNIERRHMVATPTPKEDNSVNGDDARARERKSQDDEQNRQRDADRNKQREDNSQRSQDRPHNDAAPPAKNNPPRSEPRSEPRETHTAAPRSEPAPRSESRQEQKQERKKP